MKIVLDLFHNYKEDIFDYRVCDKIIGGSWIGVFYEASVKNGDEVVLAERYLRDGAFSKNDLIISEGYTRNTEALVQAGAMPLVVFSGESPNVDWKFYLRLKWHTKRYRYALLFAGTRQYVSERASFYPFFWPNNLLNKDRLNNGVDRTLTLGQKKMLVMVASNKKQGSTASFNIRLNLVKAFFLKLLTNIVPSLILKDLYSYRMQAIKYFSNVSGFDLYGKGWERSDNLTKGEKEAVSRLCPQPIEDKYFTLSNYKFALCFENCVYPGYITEKIFDCFFAGCIPVYYGAPDISDYIPVSTFIDARKFKNFSQLQLFLEHISEKAIENYQFNIRQYLSDQSFSRYTDTAFSKKLVSFVEQEKMRHQ